MRRLLLLCCTLLCLVVSRVQGNIIVVTSSADAGSGSLRQAILNAAANGTAEIDSIHFNISQTVFNQRIINLASPLPPLSSNLVIDGTSQNGESFGNTDAKICLRKDDYAIDFTLFTVSDVTNVKLYGLYMYYGYHEGVFDNSRSQDLYAIALSDAFDIEIGAPGKGNVINGYAYGIFSFSDSCRNIRIQSNYIGQGQYYPDILQDVDDSYVPVVAAIQMMNAKDVLIGGATAAEGNLLTADRAILLDSRYNVDNGFVRIQNNIIGKYYDRTRILGGQDTWYANIHIGIAPRYFGYYSRTSIDYELHILNNEIPTSLGLDGLSKNFIIKANAFDIPTGSAAYTNMTAKLSIYNCTDGLVGGGPDTEINTFRNGGIYGLLAIDAVQNAGLTISKNIFECNVQGGVPIFLFSGKTDIPFVRVNQFSATQVSGTATPNCVIELFYDDDCEACEGKTFAGATVSDAGGNWSATGNFTAAVLATATTTVGATGQFSMPETDQNNVAVTHPTCGQANGSITGLAISGGDGYMWKDINGNVVSNSLDLLNVGPGQYLFYAKLGNSCSRFGGFFQLLEQDPGIQLDSSQLQITPSCAPNSGSIEGMVVSGATDYSWINVTTGNEVANTPDLLNMEPGTYQLQASNNSGCTVQSFSYTITESDAVKIGVTNVSTRMAHCNQDNGFVQINGFNNDHSYLSFHWLADSTTYLGLGSQLSNLAPGRYQMIATDTNGCEKQVYAVSITRMPAPSIDARQLSIISDTCQRSVGAITGIAIRDAGNSPQYKWHNAATQVVGQQIGLQNIASGDYYLEVTDAFQCTVSSQVFTVNNISKQLAPPAYANITIPKAAPFTLEPLTPATGTYILYNTSNGGTPLQQNNTGRFELPGLTSDGNYYIENQQGGCNSPRMAVEVKVVDESKIVLPNAFSPNGDGLHETWGLRVYGIVKLNYLRVFNRWGQLIFETNDINRRWDGKLNGNSLPVGTYYWVLKAVDHLGKPISQSGPVVIVR